ncbi:DUF992 domain-containing protein [Chelatococcus reniformis]|uniref:DUF992 domain-containing protein n=1 Tax=Chelatococcus reniformis TaxID=1494448 RepID=A0A916U695_9HYPH|nr:DUF992 domain-containing protein [Chelatococcus reniformis]GGC61013.1 hypothetical protein GCM10010994_19510 [Chelatococcus reniformis]
MAFARRFLTPLAVALALTGATIGTSSAQEKARVGTLSCDVSAGIGLILVQKQSLNCVFTPDKGGVPGRYVGSITEYGVALGAVQAGHLVWGVIAATSGIAPGALAGTYAGAGAEATAGVGVGANVLIGGTGRAFSLQPLSVEGQVGVNIAGGITAITLTAAP